MPIAPSIRSQVLARKLRLLARLISGNRSDSNNLSLGSVAFNHLAMNNVYNITLIRQCLYLEEYFGTHITALMLEDRAPSLRSSLNEQLCIKSRKLAFQKASEHMSLQQFLEIEAMCPWMQLWDWALGYGVKVKIL